MSMFRKPSTKALGLKVLILGETGVGKSRFGLSFPKIFALDSENGISLYEGGQYGKNLLGVANTQDFNELQEAIEEIEELVEDEEGAVGTLVVDSETKYFQNLNDAVLTVEEKKARKKGADVNDTNVSIRGYGRIKNIGIRLQNLKIDLSAKGVNVVSVAQIEDVKTKVGDQFVVTGFKPIMAKNASYDYDLILKLFVEKSKTGEFLYKAEVLKDRTEVKKVGDIVDNPSYEIWKPFLESRKGAEKLSTSLSSDSSKAVDALEEEDRENEKTTVDKLKEAMGKSAEHQKTAVALIQEAGIKNPLEPSAVEAKRLEEIIAKVNAI